MKNKNKLLSYIDALFFAILVGGGETYFTAYSLSLDHGELKAGLIATLPMAFGGVLQLLTPLIVNKIQRYRIWVYFSALVQSLLLLLPLIYHELSYPIFFGLVCLYWALFFSSSSVWSAWMSQAIGASDYVNFFSKRNAFIYTGTLLGMVISGIILNQTNNFKIIFLMALICRLISCLAIYLKDDYGIDFRPMTTLNKGFFKEIKNYSNMHSVTTFILFFRGTVFIAAPFFTPYMFEVLKFNYFQYMTIISANFVGRVIVMRLVKGVLNEKNIRLFFMLSAIGVAILPIVWIIYPHYYYLLFIEIFSGIVWGLFELIFLLKVFQKIPTEKNGTYNISLNLYNSLMIAFASLVGGLIFFGLSKYLPNFKYEYLFIISTSLRFLCLYFMPPLDFKSFSKAVIPFVRPIVGRPSLGIARVNWRILRELKRIKSTKK